MMIEAERKEKVIEQIKLLNDENIFSEIEELVQEDKFAERRKEVLKILLDESLEDVKAGRVYTQEEVEKMFEIEFDESNMD